MPVIIVNPITGHARYQSMLKRNLPAIGHIRLDKLQPHHLMELYKDMGDDVNHRGLSFLATDDLMEVIEEKEYTRETLARLTEIHINTIYNIFKDKPVSEQTARKVCGVLSILFEEAFEPSKPIEGLSNKTRNALILPKEMQTAGKLQSYECGLIEQM